MTARQFIIEDYKSFIQDCFDAKVEPCSIQRYLEDIEVIEGLMQTFCKIKLKEQREICAEEAELEIVVYDSNKDEDVHERNAYSSISWEELNNKESGQIKKDSIINAKEPEL